MPDWFDIANEVPTITDWIAAISAAIGIPLVVMSLYRLFKKDEDKEQRLQILQSQIDELSKQTSEFQRQTSLMIEANEIGQKQYDLLELQHVNSSKVAEKRLDIEKRKRLAEIKPYFLTSSGQSSPREFKFNFNNKGNDAKNIQLKVNSDSLAFFNPLSKEIVESGEPLIIIGRADQSKTNLNSNQVPFEIVLSFKDQDDNAYEQNLSRTRGGSISISPPNLTSAE